MQKLRVPVSSFQFGEVSPSLLMRTDSPIYSSSAQSLQNMLVMSEGSVKKRYGLKHLYNYTDITYDADHTAKSHWWKMMCSEGGRDLISGEQEQGRCCRLGWEGGGTVEATITAETTGSGLTFAEEHRRHDPGARCVGVMFICHPLFMPRMLIRTSLTSFEITPYSFDSRLADNAVFPPYTSFQPNGRTIAPSAAM